MDQIFLWYKLNSLWFSHYYIFRILIYCKQWLQEPLLYRCFMTVRLWQSYASVNAKRASSTRLDILCECMAFTVSEPQLPMLMRLAALCLALHRKKVSQTNIPQPSDDPGVEKSEDDAIGRLCFYNFISYNEGHLERTSEQIVSKMSKHFCCG